MGQTLERLTIAAFSVILMTSSAEADWQYTKWGMSPEDVIAAAPHENGMKIASDDKQNDYQEIEGIYSAERFHFRASMLFVERKLYAVHLATEDGGFQCSDLRRALTDIYGTSVEHGSKLFGRNLLRNTDFDLWKDTAGGNLITLYDSDPCTIVYRSPQEIERRKVKGL
ncbi:hypothetical protein HFO74_27205 [Rhizobium laguerreae]|uniref:Uncharacterized protein n=1 Tax=Rhizobium laguerreae TaxID=1076926 RepID=A0AB35FJU8_9HYPH|nr:hypothetical protein [Rhizobium laguerreae]MBY3067066.1 hypothetical protein [Rhizobium laguerreae]MBY3080065.1 hypothetical protein [Rhizobium laguerreae]